MITTTLRRIRDHVSERSWKKILAHLGKTQADDDPFHFSAIIEAVGLEGALDCCRAEPQYASVWRRYAVWCARQERHLWFDDRSLAVTDTAERYANGDATAAELAAAEEAAYLLLGNNMEYAVYSAQLAAMACAKEDAALAAAKAAKDSATAAAWEGRAKEAKASQTKEFLRVVAETEAR